MKDPDDDFYNPYDVDPDEPTIWEIWPIAAVILFIAVMAFGKGC